jgi:hypothetical protein
MKTSKDDSLELYMQHLVKYVEDIDYLSTAEEKDHIRSIGAEGIDAEMNRFNDAAREYSE